MRLTVGNVIRWDNFPYPRDGNIKPRWFIYLGRASIVAMPVFAYLCTTTTQTRRFEQGNARANHAYKRFNIKQFPMFEQDCILDFDEDLHDVTEDTLETCKDHIEIKGTLDQDTMRSIYKQFARPGVVSKIILLDIRDSYNRDGIKIAK